MPRISEATRRKRRARRLYRKYPLLVIPLMQETWSYYYNERLLKDDLKGMKPTKRKKGKRTTPNGKWDYAQKLKNQYFITRDMNTALKYNQLMRTYKQPWRLEVRKGGEIWEFFIPNSVSVTTVQQLAAKANQCNSIDEFKAIYNESKKYFQAS